MAPCLQAHRPLPSAPRLHRSPFSEGAPSPSWVGQAPSETAVSPGRSGLIRLTPPPPPAAAQGDTPGEHQGHSEAGSHNQDELLRAGAIVPWKEPSHSEGSGGRGHERCWSLCAAWKPGQLPPRVSAAGKWGRGQHRSLSDMSLHGLQEAPQRSGRALGVCQTWIQIHPSYCLAACPPAHAFTSPGGV